MKILREGLEDVSRGYGHLHGNCKCGVIARETLKQADEVKKGPSNEEKATIKQYLGID